MYIRTLTTLAKALPAVAVLILFSGMDAVEYVLHEGPLDAARLFRDMFETADINFINFIRTPASPMLLEYQDNALTFFNTPQHYITGALASLLMLQLRHQPRFLAVSGIVLAACLFWSALLSIGLLPLAAALLVKNGIRPLLTWQNLLVAPPLAGLLALYLTSGKTDFASGWLWEVYHNRFQMAADVLIFYLAEFLLMALLLWRLHPRIVREPFFIASLAILLLSPWYWYGSPRFSETTLRVVVPALFVLAWYSARAVVGRLPELAGQPGPLKATARAARPPLAAFSRYWSSYWAWGRLRPCS